MLKLASFLVVLVGLMLFFVLATAGTAYLLSLTPTYENCRKGQAAEVGQTSERAVRPMTACLGEAVDKYNGALSGISACFVATFTVILGLIAYAQFRRIREVERAYIVGGGTVVRDEAGQRFFRVDVANYGKTAAFVSDLGLEF